MVYNDIDGIIAELPAADAEAIRRLKAERDALLAELRRLEWGAVNRDEEAVCPSCWGEQPGQSPEWPGYPAGHRADCTLAELLRKFPT